MVKKVTFECEVITPMFMAGADGSTPELRPSEFKGMIRFWWRAAKAMDNIPELRRKEAGIFGGTGEGEGKSKILFKLRYDKHKLKKSGIGTNLKNDYSLNWAYDRKEKKLTGEHIGIGYLLYSTVLPRRERKYIRPGLTFNIEILSDDEKAFSETLASFWLSIYLGGFGTRSRRGGGNLNVIKSEGEIKEDLNFIVSANNKEELSEWLKSNIKKAKSLINPVSSKTYKYTNLSVIRLFIFSPQKSWIQALELIGEKFKEFREKNKHYIFETAAFGMPIMHGGFSTRIVPYKDTKQMLSDRWASPLIIKVIKSKDLYFPILIKLRNNFDSEVFVGKEKREEREWSLEKIVKINSNKIEEFIKSIKSEALEVSG